MSNPRRLIKAVKSNMIIALKYSPSPIYLPPITEDITEGNLAIIVVIVKYQNFIGVKAKKYDRRSFGVPGNKNKINADAFSFSFVLINLRD